MSIMESFTDFSTRQETQRRRPPVHAELTADSWFFSRMKISIKKYQSIEGRRRQRCEVGVREASGE
jgi:hypothetical protein